MLMNGTNNWDTWEKGDQPQFVYNYAPSNPGGSRDFRFIHGSLRWAKIIRGTSDFYGWVLCYADGFPITYADNNEPGSIRVSASGTYMTLLSAGEINY